MEGGQEQKTLMLIMVMIIRMTRTTGIFMIIIIAMNIDQWCSCSLKQLKPTFIDVFHLVSGPSNMI